MSLATIKKEQQNKLFKKADLVLYITLAVLIVVLFLVFVVDSDKNENIGFEIILEETVILTYNFDSKIYKITDGYEDYFLIEDSNNSLIITIFIDNEHSHYNQLSVSTTKKQVYMINANCSSAKDCTKMSIKDDKDVIVCVPHKLKIRGLSNNIQQPISG